MPKTIWKFDMPPSPMPPLGIGDFSVSMPVGAKIVYLAKQNGLPQLWALVNPEEVDREERHFFIAGTGKAMPHWMTYIDSWQMQDGQLIWHLFENTNPGE